MKRVCAEAREQIELRKLKGVPCGWIVELGGKERQVMSLKN